MGKISQRPKDKQKLYALHAPEVECIGKGKARQAYEFGVKVGIAVTVCKGLVVGARSFPGNPYDGDTLAEQLEQTSGLLQDQSLAEFDKDCLLRAELRGLRHQAATMSAVAVSANVSAIQVPIASASCAGTALQAPQTAQHC